MRNVSPHPAPVTDPALEGRFVETWRYGGAAGALEWIDLRSAPGRPEGSPKSGKYKLLVSLSFSWLDAKSIAERNERNATGQLHLDPASTNYFCVQVARLAPGKTEWMPVYESGACWVTGPDGALVDVVSSNTNGRMDFQHILDLESYLWLRPILLARIEELFLTRQIRHDRYVMP